jgi:hypothetical protein
MPDTIPTLNVTVSKGFRTLPDGNTLGFWPDSDGVVMQEWAGQDGNGDLLSQETYDYGKYAQYRAQHPELNLPDFSAPKTGNTIGKVVGEASVTLPTITVTANPPPAPETAAEGGFWGAVGGWVHGGLDAAGLIPGLGAVPDLLNAGIYAVEGDYVNAGISAVAAIPVVGDAALAGKYAVKGGELAVKEGEKLAAKEAEKLAAQAAKEAEEKAAKEAAEKAEKEAAEKEAGEDGAKVKKQKPHKDCGKVSTYSKAPKKLGELNADHVPSGAALKKAAEKKLKEMGIWNDLGTDGQNSILNRLYNNAPTITIPEDVHKEGRTWGNKNNAAQVKGDAADLPGAFEKDTEEIQKAMDRNDHGCSEAYAAAVKELRGYDYNALIEKIIKTSKYVKPFLEK